MARAKAYVLAFQMAMQAQRAGAVVLPSVVQTPQNFFANANLLQDDILKTIFFQLYKVQAINPLIIDLLIGYSVI